MYAISPEEKPNNSVIRAVPIATTGSSFNTNINNGEKKTAPPIPLDIAMVAMRIEIGNKYQSSNEISILNKLLINETFAKQEFLSS
jgi:hypothetical protein